ncbi:collagen-binding domain-containing protein [Paucibacter sp. AS339]|uniref:collagen-binding domain-containing protein n=1 Tax=Paucibacter hankyongi TaxID=3133434 RepID=UPI0030AA10CA
MKTTVTALASFVTLTALAAPAAVAAPLTAQQILTQFNLVTLGDAVSSNQQVDGRSFIGGSLIGGKFGMWPGAMGSSDYAGLTVMGSASGVQVHHQGAVVLGSLSDSRVIQGSSSVLGTALNNHFNGPSYVAGASANNKFNGGKLSQATAAAQAANNSNFAAEIKGLSSSLSQLASTGSTVNISDQGNRVTFSAVANSQGLAVFDLSSLDKQIFSKGEFAFDLKGANTVIFNVDETSLNFASKFLNGSASELGSKVIWNFHQATDLTIHNQFGGVILAPNATLNNYNTIQGSVLVNQLNQGGKITWNGFTGDITTAVPEPATYALLLSGLGLLGWLARGRRPDAS